MSLRILLFDENVTDLTHIDHLLADCDVEVTATADLSRAASMAGSEKFDGIFVGIPKAGECGFTRTIRQSKWNSSTPIIAIAEATGNLAMTEAFKNGASFFLQKPIDRSRLRLLINSSRGAMLENRRLLQRAPLSIKVDCWTGIGNHVLTSCNISGRGMLLQGFKGAEVGSVLKLGFRLPHQAIHIETSALIVRVDDHGRVGVSFTGMKPTDRQRIKIYVSQELYRRSDGASMETNRPLRLAYA
jgi:CheY-like chemotaxis protein